jgi:hypothetical protein
MHVSGLDGPSAWAPGIAAPLKGPPVANSMRLMCLGVHVPETQAAVLALGPSEFGYRRDPRPTTPGAGVPQAPAASPAGVF